MQVLPSRQPQQAYLPHPSGAEADRQGPVRSMTYEPGLQTRASLDGDLFRPPQRIYSIANSSTPNLAYPQASAYASLDLDERFGSMQLNLEEESTRSSSIQNGLPPRPRPISDEQPPNIRARTTSIQSLPARQHSLLQTPSEAGLYDGVEENSNESRARSADGRFSNPNDMQNYRENYPVDPNYQNQQSQQPNYWREQQYPNGQYPNEQGYNEANYDQHRSPNSMQRQPEYYSSPGLIQNQYGYQDSPYYNEPGPSNYQQAQFQPQHLDYGQNFQQNPSQYQAQYNSLHRNMSSASSLQFGAPSVRAGSALSHSPSVVSVGSSSTLKSRQTSQRQTSTSQPITKAAIDEYRNRIKTDPDPETQFNFAKYLIEAARKLGQASASSASESDAKALKRYRDALLQESLKLIKKLATQSVSIGKPAYADAQFFFANLLSSGSLGLAVDHEKAYNLYVQASKQNHAAATYRTAVCNEIAAGTRRDYNRAVLFYRKASALGDAAGMYKLGMILLNGLLEQPRNGREAVIWLKRAAQAADEDNPHALHELGLLYEKPPSHAGPIGPTVPADESQAFELFMQAAKLGYPPSQHKLGTCYEFGALTCPVDPRRSIAFYTRAAEKGHASSELALSGWYLTGSDGVLKQSDEEAFLWARRAANKGLSKAEYAVGYYFELGIGVKQDIEEAKRWYMRASAQSHKRAMQRLTELKRSAQVKGGKKAARPTRQEASSECVIM